MTTMPGSARAKNRKWAALSLLPLLMLAQCDDQKAANKTNFKAALSKFFGQSCAVLSLTDPMAGLIRGPGLGTNGKPPTDPSAATLTGDQITALEKAGVVTQKRVMQQQRNIFGQSLGTVPAVVPVLSDKGTKLWHVAGPAAGPSPSGFCDGHIEVVSVDRFTDPTTVGGVRVSNVTFTMRKHIDDWAATPAMKEAFADSLGGPDTIQTTLPMQLNNDGWGVATNPPVGASD